MNSKSKTNEVKLPVIRISRVKITNEMRLSQVRNEIQRLERAEQELRVKLDKKLDKTSKCWAIVPRICFICENTHDVK